MIEPMSPWKRASRAAFLIFILALGYIDSGALGAWAVFFGFGVCYWAWFVLSEAYNKLRKDFGGPTYQFDSKTLNMNVEPGASIHGISFEDEPQHRDPTRPDRRVIDSP